nr:DUF6076 domain-containing protein [uncultured Oscillibacter sp.]
MWTYKLHFTNDGELFESDPFGAQGAAASQREFPYQESLFSFLEMDPQEWETLLAEIVSDWDRFFSGEDAAADQAMQKMGALAVRHIYFRLPYLCWFSRKASGALRPDLTEELRRLPGQLAAYQKQAQYFIEHILDLDQVGREVQKNCRSNYICGEPKEPALFRFQPISLGFEPVDESACGLVLWPDTIRDIIDFSLRDFVTRGTPVRRCKNCGRYFPLVVRISAEYCERPGTSGKVCRATASASKWAEERRDDKVFREYRREYKRRFAWIKAGRIEPDAFYTWSEQAREKKAECEEGRITLEEYREWLRRS